MGCVDPDRATEVHLNASAPFKPDASFLSVTTVLISAFIFKALVDSSSTHKLITYSIPPIQLKLINGTSNHIITQAINIPIQSPLDMSLRLHFM